MPMLTVTTPSGLAGCGICRCSMVASSRHAIAYSAGIIAEPENITPSSCSIEPCCGNNSASRLQPVHSICTPTTPPSSRHGQWSTAGARRSRRNTASSAIACTASPHYCAAGVALPPACATSACANNIPITTMGKYTFGLRRTPCCTASAAAAALSPRSQPPREE
ncbi:hypothetical protein OZ12_05255 [Xanthomonas translucens pv. translucens]|nr:hypothetical protein OZ12_05255 [Xanthomonas translucens pv. translucens]